MRGGNPAPQIEWLLDNKNVTKEVSLRDQVQFFNFLVLFYSIKLSFRVLGDQLKSEHGPHKFSEDKRWPI